MSKLKNYLRTFRRRVGLSQRHVAILLGSRDQTRISNYELNKRVPNIDVVLAFEIILGVPAKALFAGRAAIVEDLIRKRATNLPDDIAAELIKKMGNSLPADAEKLLPE